MNVKVHKRETTLTTLNSCVRNMRASSRVSSPNNNNNNNNRDAYFCKLCYVWELLYDAIAVGTDVSNHPMTN